MIIHLMHQMTNDAQIEARSLLVGIDLISSSKTERLGSIFKMKLCIMCISSFFVMYAECIRW